MEYIAYYGVYEYPPEAFKPGETVTLRIWQQGKPEPKVSVIDLIVLNRIWNDFTPYFEALESDVAGDDGS